MLGSSIQVGTPNTLPSTAAVDVPDDILFTIGSDSDSVIVNNVATLLANTALTGVLEGTPVSPALAANTLIIANQTNDGDILIAASDGGTSKACFFFDASTPDLYLYQVGGTWTAGASTWTIPAVTLGGNVIATNRTFNAGADHFFIASTGGARGIKVTNTNDGSDGVGVYLEHVSTTPAANDIVVVLRAQGRDLNANAVNYAGVKFEIEDATSGSADGKLQIELLSASVANQVLTLSSLGELGVDASGDSGTYANVELFDDYDDVQVLRQGIQQRNRELLADMGVFDRKDSGSGYMMKIQPMVRLLAGGIYQTRAMIERLAEKTGVNPQELLKETLALPQGG